MSTVAFAGAGSFCIKDTGWRHQTMFGGAASLRTFVLRSENHGMLPTEARLPFRVEAAIINGYDRMWACARV
jgi:hypothetical protein